MSTAQRQPFLLVVDDSPEICLIVQHLARRAGQEVDCCGDVPSAWDRLQKKQPDLLILDVNLPGEDGLVLCRRVRLSADMAKLKIALFSHWDRSADITAGLTAGADYVLSKELLCQPEDWQNRVNGLLNDTDSRAVRLSLSLKEARLAHVSAPKCAAEINQALRQAVLRSLDHEVMQVLFARAAARVGWELREDWLLPDGRGVRPERLCADQAENILGFALALKEEIWCVVGTAGSAAFAATLAAGIPPLAEILGQP
jgi:DNA-binding response OmpR family regulator